MKFAVLFPLSVALLLTHPSSVRALDCAKASSKVEKLFCATPELKAADEAMSAAYFKLLRETTDTEFHEELIRSQRRWLKIRADGPDRFGQAEDDKTDDRDVLLKMTRDRLRFLQSGEPVRIMEQERDVMSKDSGGAFAGFRTFCVLQPPPYGNWSYECWGTVHRQHNDRICSSVKEWASGHTTEYRFVSVLKNSVPEPAAFCSTDHDGLTNGPTCPGISDDPWIKADAHWSTSLDTAPGYSPASDARDIWKYDPDIEPDVIKQQWMHDCLFAPVFPPPELSRSNSKANASGR
jgi:uncharacterized protein YecT (DUF1311 family)